VAVLDRLVDVQQLRWAQLRRGLLTAFAAFFFALGWVLFWLARSVKVSLTAFFFSIGYAASWSYAAVKVGWRAGEAGRRGPA
jgi:hypothetical protein